MLTLSGNPVLSTPDGARLDEALAGLDFMAAVDIYVNETTRHADVILPPTSALERDHYDLIFQTFGVRNTARFTPAVFEKEAGARHDWQIYRDVALATISRLDDEASAEGTRELRGRLSLSPTRLIGLLLARGRTGVTLRSCARTRPGIDLGPLRAPPAARAPPDPRPPHRPGPGAGARRPGATDRVEAPDEDELLLIGRRHQQDCNSWMHNTERLTRGKPRHQLLHAPRRPGDARLEDGAVVRSRHASARCEVEVAATDDMMPGVVSLPHGYGHAAIPDESRREVPGVSINDLTDPERLDVSGQRGTHRRTRHRRPAAHA